MIDRISKYSGRGKQNNYLYTKGGEFSLEGVDYVGEYHIEGAIAKTGPVPTNESKVLRRPYNDPNVYAYDRIVNFKTPILYYQEPKPIILNISNVDYSRGFIYRYFTENTTIKPYTVEIDKVQYDQIGKPGGIDPNTYASAIVKWKLTGTLEEIEQENTKQIVEALKSTKNILYSIRSYTEYSTPR